MRWSHVGLVLLALGDPAFGQVDPGYSKGPYSNRQALLGETAAPLYLPRISQLAPKLFTCYEKASANEISILISLEEECRSRASSLGGIYIRPEARYNPLDHAYTCAKYEVLGGALACFSSYGDGDRTVVLIKHGFIYEIEGIFPSASSARASLKAVLAGGPANQAALERAIKSNGGPVVAR